MMEDIEQFNTQILLNENNNNNIEQITENNLLNYSLDIDENEKPIIQTVEQIKKRRASRLSNIMISPIPKQYRKLHLTPKSTGSDNGKQNKIRRKRYPSNQFMSGQSHHDERKD